MVYYCADDYGISGMSNRRIAECVENGALNKISVLPNGEIDDWEYVLSQSKAELSLHINLVEGIPLSDKKNVGILLSDSGTFKYSFIGLLVLSISRKRKELEKALYNELKSQVRWWKRVVGDRPILIDSHQHTHMIPLVFRTLMKVLKDEGVIIKYLRIPQEPIIPYLLTPSLYFTYNPVNIIKQSLLNFFALVNTKEIKKGNISAPYCMGILFSGKMDEKRVSKLLPKYINYAKRNKKEVELVFHPGYLESDEEMMKGIRNDFEKFYYSPWRKVEFDTLKNLKHK